METLKLSFFAVHGKTSYLFFLGADFRAPKSGHRCENRSVLGPVSIWRNKDLENVKSNDKY